MHPQAGLDSCARPEADGRRRCILTRTLQLLNNVGDVQIRPAISSTTENASECSFKHYFLTDQRTNHRLQQQP
jgi:hypothetical protein